jgi:aryl-alcohol dehydrogenase-like predicted oxidoreductase
MERRTLGPNGFEVPVVGMGTSRTFDVRGRAAEATSRRIVEEALDVGANLFDSSPMYGEAERVLGLALDGRRAEAIVATKVWTADDDLAERQIEASLHHATAGSSCTRSTTWSPGQPGWTGWRSSATRA